jgi:hypothetical protein
MNIDGMTLVLFFLSPPLVAGPQKPHFNSSLKNGYFGEIIFQEIDFFEHLKCNFKSSWPQKISIFKKHFTGKIILILMIKKMPLTVLDVEK